MDINLDMIEAGIRPTFVERKNLENKNFER
jgi:hypothetical protein